MNEFLKKVKQQGGEHILFIGATILSAGVHFIYSIYVKAYVQPLEYGMYSTCLLLQTYMAYFQMGSLNAFNRDYPQLIGAGKSDEATKYRNTVFSFIIITYSICLCVATICITVIGKAEGQDSRLVIGFILTAILTVITVFENYGNYRCRIDHGFKFSSLVTILELLSIPVGLLIVSKIGYYGIYITSILAMVIGVILYFKPSFRDFRFMIDGPLLKRILISGTPLLINGLIWTVVNSIDKFVILGFINTEALGVYGIAQNAFSYMVLIPSAMSQLFYVKMGKEYGASEDINVLVKVSMRFSTLLAAITSIIALIAYFFLPILVNVFMPNYSNGVPSAQILILGLSVYAATLINGNILTILKKNGALLINSILMCVFNAICSIGFVIVFGATIESVALGTATSYIFCTLIIVCQVYKYAHCKIWPIIKASVIPVCISLVPGVVAYNMIENRIAGFGAAIVFVVLFYGFFYRKQILSIRKG